MFFFMFPWSTAPDIPRNPQESAPSSASIWRHWAQGQAQKWVHWLTGSNLGTPTMREWCFFGEYAIVPFFPECVARVPVSLWGSGGWGCVRSTLRSRAQPSATVRSRPQPFAWGPYGRAYGKFCRGDPFWRFQTSGCFVSRGRRGTSWHSDVFCNVSKVVLRGRRNTFATFSEDVLQFSWQAQHFGRVHRHFSWQAQHFRRVLWRVFCKSYWQGCVKWWQGANSVAGVAFCAMCWKLTEASHETSILRLQIFRF